MQTKHLLTNMRKRRLYLESIRSALGNSLPNSIDGTLNIKSQNGLVRFFRRTKEKQDYLPKSQIDVIKALAQKRYESQLLKSIDEEIRLLDQCIDTLSGHVSPEDVYDKQPSELKALTSKRISGISKENREWQNAPYRKKKPPENLDFISMRNERTRSKSETIVADRLFVHGVPYHYEELMMIDGTDPIYPDFTIRHPRTGKKIIWEHMGRMDDPDYARESLKRINDLAREGFFQGDNLIITMESRNSPLSTAYIEKMIELFLT